MTNVPDGPLLQRTQPKTWRIVVIESLLPYRGSRALPLGAIYDAVEAHPVVRRRSPSKQRVRSKVRQVLQRLKAEGVIRTRGPGQWDILLDLGR